MINTICHRIHQMLMSYLIVLKNTLKILFKQTRTHKKKYFLGPHYFLCTDGRTDWTLLPTAITAAAGCCCWLFYFIFC